MARRVLKPVTSCSILRAGSRPSRWAAWPLVSYDRKQLDLKIVPVNGATVPAGLAQQLNVIYRQVVAEFRVEVLPNLEVKDLSGNTTFSNADNALLSRYTSHMNKVIRTFKRAYGLDDDTYCLFLIPKPTTPLRPL